VAATRYKNGFLLLNNDVDARWLTLAKWRQAPASLAYLSNWHGFTHDTRKRELHNCGHPKRRRHRATVFGERA
jgi:hypothetical protein